MIIGAALLLLHLLSYKCIRSTNMSVSPHTTRTDLPKSGNEMACYVIRISASSYTNVTFQTPWFMSSLSSKYQKLDITL